MAWRLAAALAFLAAALPAQGPVEPVTLSAAWSATGVKAGGRILLGVVLDIAPPWHVGAHGARGDAIPVELQELALPDGVTAGEPAWPLAHTIPFGPSGGTASVYSGRAVIVLPLLVAPDVATGDLPVKVCVSWQACDDRQCLFPVTRELAATLAVVGAGAEPEPLHADLFVEWKEGATAEGDRLEVAFFGLDFSVGTAGLWVVLLLAFAGGVLLNLTPCVLPVIPLKIMGLAQAAGEGKRCLLLGVVMSLGVVAFWLGLGAAISGISGFTATNQLFRYPAFTVGVGVVIALMAVGMCGLFSVPLPQFVYRLNPRHDSLLGSFGFGVMTAVLATPCTAPFMGAAAAWAATRRPLVTLVTFAAIGLGMALPYLVLSARPGLVRRVPRAGPASVLVKQVMGLLMLAAAAYFVGTGVSGLLAEPPDAPGRGYWWAVAALVAAAGLWMTVRTFGITSRSPRRLFFGGLGLVMAAGAGIGGARLADAGPIDWVAYTPERLQAAFAEEKAVMLDYTAAWCLNCQALEQAVLHDARVVALLEDQDIVPMKVDFTGSNPSGAARLLATRPAGGIPWLEIWDRGGRKRVLGSDAYTIAQVVSALQAARGR